MSYGRRSRYYSDSSNRFAERHIREAAEFSELVGGADAEVKNFFFSLPPNHRDAVFRAYGRIYGASAESYARGTFEKWRSGNVQMSGLVAKRLFSLLPNIMSSEQKYDIARHIWEKSAPSSSIQLAIGPMAPLDAIMNTLTQHMSSVLTEHMIPSYISSGFKWLSDNDVIFYEKLLNHFREQESRQILERAQETITSLQHLAATQGANTKAESTFTVHKHSIYIKVIPSLGDKIQRYDTFKPRTESSSFPWLGLIIGAILLYLFFK